MSALVKLGTKLPGDRSINGLDDIADDLVSHPDAVRVCVVWVDVEKITSNVDEAVDVPTVRVRRILPLGLADAVPDSLQKAILKADEDRLGMSPLPFDEVESSGASKDSAQLGFDDDEDDDGGDDEDNPL
jgi:hypothetical protein